MDSAYSPQLQSHSGLSLTLSHSFLNLQCLLSTYETISCPKKANPKTELTNSCQVKIKVQVHIPLKVWIHLKSQSIKRSRLSSISQCVCPNTENGGIRYVSKSQIKKKKSSMEGLLPQISSCLICMKSPSSLNYYMVGLNRIRAATKNPNLRLYHVVVLSMQVVLTRPHFVPWWMKTQGILMLGLRLLKKLRKHHL